jgi:hypothetical protein
MIGFLRALRKRRTIRNYIRKLGPDLRRNHGSRRYYTPEQVRRSAHNTGVDMHDLCYAYSAYCSPADFDNYHQQTGEPCDYDAMRQEVADVCLDGNSSFDAADLYAASDPHSGETSGDAGGDGGHASGGGDGGGGGD